MLIPTGSPLSLGLHVNNSLILCGTNIHEYGEYTVFFGYFISLSK